MYIGKSSLRPLVITSKSARLRKFTISGAESQFCSTFGERSLREEARRNIGSQSALYCVIIKRLSGAQRARSCVSRVSML